MKNVFPCISMLFVVFVIIFFSDSVTALNEEISMRALKDIDDDYSIFIKKGHSLSSVGLAWDESGSFGDSWGYVDGVINQKLEVGGPMLLYNNYRSQTGTIVFFVPISELRDLLASPIDYNTAYSKYIHTYSLKVVSWFMTPEKYKNPVDSTGFSTDELDRLTDSSIEMCIIPDIPNGNYYILIGERYWDSIKGQYVDCNGYTVAEQYIITNSPYSFSKKQWIRNKAQWLKKALSEYIVSVDSSVTDEIDDKILADLDIDSYSKGSSSSDNEKTDKTDIREPKTLSSNHQTLHKNINQFIEQESSTAIIIAYAVSVFLLVLLILQTRRVEIMKKKVTGNRK